MWNQVLATLVVGIAATLATVIGKVLNEWSTRSKTRDGNDALMGRKMIDRQNKFDAELSADRAKAEAAEVRAGAIEALSMGVDTIAGTFVAEIKAKASDGKLSTEEIEEARDMAAKEAVKVATNPDVVAFIIGEAIETIGAIITSIVQGKKTK